MVTIYAHPNPSLCPPCVTKLVELSSFTLRINPIEIVLSLVAYLSFSPLTQPPSLSSRVSESDRRVAKARRWSVSKRRPTGSCELPCRVIEAGGRAFEIGRKKWTRSIVALRSGGAGAESIVLAPNNEVRGYRSRLCTPFLTSLCTRRCPLVGSETCSNHRPATLSRSTKHHNRRSNISSHES